MGPVSIWRLGAPGHFDSPDGGPSDFLNRDVELVADAGFVSATSGLVARAGRGRGEFGLGRRA